MVSFCIFPTCHIVNFLINYNFSTGTQFLKTPYSLLKVPLNAKLSVDVTGIMVVEILITFVVGFRRIVS